MNLKKCFVFLLTILLMIPMLCIGVSAAEPQYRYELTVDGKDTVEVDHGDLITVTLHLYRTDAEEAYTMYAMQDEIRYDSDFLELVEDSPQLLNGVDCTDIRVAENLREFYMNFLSFSGGTQWQAKTRVGTFQLRVIGTTGVTTVTNEDFLVSLPDGSGSYPCEANELTVILSTDCIIKFETNGGTPIDSVTAIYGELLQRPEDPIREGKHLVGWFKDIHLTEEWNFETDTVKGNMTLYAKWADGDPIVGSKLSVLLYIALLLLALAGLLILFLLWKRKAVKYSLVNGDVALDYRNGDKIVQIDVVLIDDGIKHHLARSEIVEAKQRLRFIKNATNMAIADIEPGTYDGKLLIHDGSETKVKECRIKVLGRKLDEKSN